MPGLDLCRQVIRYRLWRSMIKLSDWLFRKKRAQHRQFLCVGCGCDWMTVLPDIKTCQVCYHMGQPDIVNWITHCNNS